MLACALVGCAGAAEPDARRASTESADRGDLTTDSGTAGVQVPRPLVLKPEAFRHHVEDFNRNDRDLYPGHIPNAGAWEFLKNNIPLLDCPDPDIQSTYYFRWWTYRKHLKRTPGGFIVDEFLPNVPWAGKYNSISCAAGHHLYEGRWLRDPGYLDDYARFWFRGGGEPRRYSFWAADAIWARTRVTGDPELPLDLLPDLAGDYREKAASLKKLVQEQLWDAGARLLARLPARLLALAPLVTQTP